MSGFLDKAKRNIARGKQLALEKMDKAGKTKDAEFEEWQKTYEGHYKMVEKVQKDLEKVSDLLKQISLYQSEVSMDFMRIYDSGQRLYPAVAQYNSTTKLVDAERIRYEEEVNGNILTPIAKYLGQFKEIKDRIGIHNTRRIDMDRYARDVKTHFSNNHLDKMRRAEDKLEITKTAYNTLHDELVEDMRNLYHDKEKFFDPVVSSYHFLMSDYYNGTSRVLDQCVPSVQHINREAAHEYEWVISQSTNTNSGNVQTGSPHQTHISQGSPTHSPTLGSHQSHHASSSASSAYPPQYSADYPGYSEQYSQPYSTPGASSYQPSSGGYHESAYPPHQSYQAAPPASNPFEYEDIQQPVTQAPSQTRIRSTTFGAPPSSNPMGRPLPSPGVGGAPGARPLPTPGGGGRALPTPGGGASGGSGRGSISGMAQGYAANAASNAATNPAYQQRVGSAVATQANNPQNQARVGSTIANNSNNPMVRAAANNKTVQGMGGRAFGAAANNSAVQQRVGQQVSNQIQQSQQPH